MTRDAEIAEQEKALQEARREVAHLMVKGLDHTLLPRKRDAYRRLERSARAEVALAVKALQHLRSRPA
jgi:hypothetical protein